MRDLIILIACLLVLFVYVGNLKVSFKPLSIIMENWLAVIGWMAIIAGIVMLSIHYQNKGYDKGQNDTIKIIEEQLINKTKVK